MRVLIIQENGRHDKNRDFRECFSLQRAFKYHGHETIVWGLGHQNFKDKIDFHSFDIIFNLENYGDNWLPDLRNVNKPRKFLWSIDAHYRGIQPFENNFKKGYNILLHSTKDYVTQSYHQWFPNCYDHTLIYPKENIEKRYKFGFCGNYANRKDLLESLVQKFNMKLDIFVIGNDMVNAINSYHCHFNKNIFNDINYRSFETIGCKTLLLTNYNSQYEMLGFKHNVNCLMYHNMEECYDIMKNIDNYDIERIRNGGWELSSQHNYFVRIKQFLDVNFK